MVVKLRKSIDIKVVAIPVLCSFVTINAGLWLLNTYPERLLRFILAFLLLFVTAIFAYGRKHQLVIKNKWYNGALIGLITGITTGMFNIVGPFFMLYYLSVCDDLQELKASLELSFLITSVYDG